MYKANVNNKFQFTLNDDSNIKLDIIKVKDGSFHLIKNDKSYSVEVVKSDTAEKTFILKVNGTKYECLLKDKYDELLHSLGFDTTAVKKINNVKAPMPGMVLSILVEDGHEVKKGDALIILEAMKMENILKAPVDAKIKKIIIKKGTAVEKNQVLIEFN